MKEWGLQILCRWLTRRTEGAYLRGDKDKALKWSQRLDKIIYQLMLIKNRYILKDLHFKKAS